MNAKQNTRLNQLIREMLRIMPDTFSLTLKQEAKNEIILTAEIWMEHGKPLPIEFMVSDAVAGARSNAVSFNTLDEADMFYDLVVETGWENAMKPPTKRHSLGA